MATRCAGNSSDSTSNAFLDDPAHRPGDSVASDGSHLAGDTFVAIAFYNVGLNNKELLGQKWNKKNCPKQRKLQDDIESIFAAEHAIQALFLTEFGGMDPTIDELLLAPENLDVEQPLTKTYFENMLKRIPTLSFLIVHVEPPYVALVDPTYWHVHIFPKCVDLCTETVHFAMLLGLVHQTTGDEVGVFNCHIPTPTKTDKRKMERRKKETVQNMCRQLAKVHRSHTCKI